MAKLNLVVVAHDRRLLELECAEVGLPGRLGDLGVLPGHAALLATLRPGVLVYRETGGASHEIAVSGGFCEVSDDSVTVLVPNARLPSEVDVAASRSAKEEAEERLLSAGPDDLLRLQDQLAEAEAHLSIAV